ncbi:MAG: ABC transporter ATP-binding protein [Alphaproteobacteria bacterium]|nr:ABC transporter ATP-binding protein [Alphaproteobacteria bacterium]
MSRVEARAVRKAYGAVKALDGVSLTFEDGSFSALLGPSGSGKTTLLRAFAGFVTLDSGTIAIDGKLVNDVPPHRRDLGMVFQNYALFPHMTVAENIAFGLSVRGAARAAIAERVEAMLRLVRLEGFGARKPRQLSGGQQQRVALARALVTRPRVLLLDEPLGALDRRLRQEMQIELKQIQREVGITAIFVTHDQEEALTLADRVAVINEGRLVQVGMPGEVYERPATRFVAGFLGDANLFEGRVAGGRVAVGGGAIATEDALPTEGAPAILAVRPEKVVLAADAAGLDADLVNRLEGRIVQAVYAGSAITYIVEAGDRRLIVFEQNRAAAPLGPDTAVIAAFAPRHAVLVQP